MSRRVVVDSFDALAAATFDDGVNACCYARDLVGDFDGVARAVAAGADAGVVVVDEAALAGLADLAGGDPAVAAAVAVIVDDLRRLTALGRDPVLNCITAYARDERGLAIATDVLSFHADRAPIEADTWMCTYAGAPSEGLDNACARRLVDDPAVRAALDESGVVDEAFDLHYGVVDDAGVFSFGRGNLWRIAIAWPAARVPPCIHRAPAQRPGDPPRLLLLC